MPSDAGYLFLTHAFSKQVRIALLMGLIQSFSWISHGHAQENDVFERFSLESGLSSFGVTALLQDTQGFLWIGTIDGLNRFDGHQFLAYRNDPTNSQTLSGNTINPGALLEHGGGLWIGTRSGLNRLDFATGRFNRYSLFMQGGGQLDDRITAIERGFSDDLWVGTMSGLGRLDGSSGEVLKIWPVSFGNDSLGTKRITSLKVDKAGRLWVGTTSGLFMFDASSDVPLHIAPALHYISALYESDEHGILIGLSNGGLAKLHEPGFSVQYLKSPSPDETSSSLSQIMAIEEDAQGTLYLATWGDGLCRKARSVRSWTCLKNDLTDEKSLASDQLADLLIDKTGNLFAATWNGLNKKHVTKAFTVLPFQPDSSWSLTHPRVNAVHEKDGILWVGLNGGGVNRIDRSVKRVLSYTHDPLDENSIGSNEIWSITEDSIGNLWVGTGGGGLNKLMQDGRRFKRYLPEADDPQSISDKLIYSTYIDRNNVLWISTVTNGINKYDSTHDNFVKYPMGAKNGPSHNSVWPMFEDSRGTFWIGTIGDGINLFNRNEDQFSLLKDSLDVLDALNAANILSIQESQNGSIWIGTLGDGAFRIKFPVEAVEQFSVTNGMGDNNAGCILPGDDNDVWIGTTNGLAYYDGRAGQFTTNYTLRDGLPSMVFNPGACFKAESGELLFGTARGLVSFYPKEINNNNIAPVTVLTALELLDESLRLDSVITHKNVIELRHFEDELTFRFAALDFTAPIDHRYAYRLDGVDEGWKLSQENWVRYPGLKPGEYVFRVKGTNNDGVFSRQEASLHITINPPWWQLWWVRFPVIGLLLVGVLGGVRWRYMQRLKVERLERRLETEREVTRRRIVRNLHDELGSEISAIALRLERTGRSETVSLDTRTIMLDVWDQVMVLTEKIRDMSWVLESRNDQLSSLIDRLQAKTYKLFTDYSASFFLPETIPAVSLDMEAREHLYMLGAEALNNAARHANASDVRVEIQCDDHMLTIIIQDDGCGFDPAKINPGNGLLYMKERAELMNAVLEIRSTVGSGTKVMVKYTIA